MHRRPRAAIAAAVAAIATIAGGPGAARADEPIGFAFDTAMGGGLYLGEVGAQANRLAPHLRIGAGLGRGPWAALVSVEMPMVTDLPEAQSAAQPAPPSLTFLGVGVGPSVRRELTRGGDGLRAHVRLGYAWRWLRADGQVRRTCQVHGGCAGGFWSETPTYPADGPTLAIGASARIAGRTPDAHWLAVGFELAAGYLRVDRLGSDPDVTGMFVSLGINIAIGRGGY